jgi:hypothetical protein
MSIKVTSKTFQLYWHLQKYKGYKCILKNGWSEITYKDIYMYWKEKNITLKKISIKHNLKGKINIVI